MSDDQKSVVDASVATPAPQAISDAVPRRPSIASAAEAESQSVAAQLAAAAAARVPAPLPSTSFRRTLQTIRAVDLEREAALYAHHIALEDEFWRKQEERFSLCLKRAQLGAASSRDLLAYLKRSSKLLLSVAESLQGLGSFGVTPPETGTMRVACMSVDIVRKSTGSYLQELDARVYGESMARAASAVETSAYVQANMESVGSDALTMLKFQRKQVQDAWNAYIAQSQERAKLEAAGKPLKTDPFLLCRVYESELHTLQTQEVKFCALMASLMRDLEAHDLRRMTATKATLLDNLLAQKAVLEHTVKFTDNALLTIKAIDPAADVKEFAASADLYLPPAAGRRTSSASAVVPATVPSESAAAAMASGASSTDAAALLAHSQTEQAVDARAKETPTVAFLQPAPTRDANALGRVYAHEIEKEGPLYRQGAVITSRWKPCHAVLTASGFIHLFKEPKSHQTRLAHVHSSLSLDDAVSVEAVTLPGPAGGFEGGIYTVVIKFSRGGLFSSNGPVVTFKLDNADQQAEWVLHIQKHVTPLPTPAAGDSPNAVAAAAAASAAAAPAVEAAAAPAAAAAAQPSEAKQ